MEFDARVLAEGSGAGDALVLSEPLSFWGGLDHRSGEIIDHRHPQKGERVGGRVVVMPAGRGSSSASSVLAEVIRAGVGPSAIVMSSLDPILVLGSMVAAELYGKTVPIVVVRDEELASIAPRSHVEVRASQDGGAVLVRAH